MRTALLLLAMASGAAASAGAQLSPQYLLQLERGPAERLAELGNGGTVLLEPRPGLRLRARLQRHDEPFIGPVWIGTIEGDPYGFVHLREEGGGLAGRIRTSSESLLVAPRPGGTVVSPEAQAPPLPDLARRLPERLRGHQVRATRAAAPTTESTFDVLVILDREAGNESPIGMPWVIDLVESGIVELNLALRNSGVNAQARLVKIKRDNYPPAGRDFDTMEDMLERLTDRQDEYFRRAHAWRDRFGADFVALVSRKNESLCGLAWLAGKREGAQPGDEAGAFSVTNWRCLESGTLAHEIGHNMGLQHARVNPTNSRLGAYDYSFGHLVEGEFATVMAYLCVGCSGIPYFSNPDVSVGGVPTGVAGAAPAANALSIERDREVLAAFRPCRRNCGAS